MRTIPIALAPQYTTGEATLCKCLRIERADGTVFAATSADVDVVVSGVTLPGGADVNANYRAVHGLDVQQWVASLALSVGNTELTVIPDQDDQELEIALQTGLFDNAAWVLLECNYLAPGDGVNVLGFGRTGDVRLLDGSYVVELRDVKQALQQPIGIVSSKTCRARFADYPQALPDARCRLDVLDWTVTGTITAVPSARQQVTDSLRSEADDWFGEGVFTATSGANAGYNGRVSAYAADSFTFALPFPFAFEVGDTYEAIAGCRKRHERTSRNPGGVSDCADKFDNLVNFQGEPHAPGIDQLTRPAGSTSE